MRYLNWIALAVTLIAVFAIVNEVRRAPKAAPSEWTRAPASVH